LSLEDQVIDATTEEGKQKIKELEAEAAAAKESQYDDPE
jgi:cell division cycle protein 37